jgi:transposase, IS6 family
MTPRRPHSPAPAPPSRASASHPTSSCRRWFVDETDVKVGGRWRYVYRAVDQVEVVTDHAPVYPGVLKELAPAAWHLTDQYANNRVEADHVRLKARLWPMRGLKQERSARIVIVGHAFVENVRRDCYELAVEEPASRRVAVAFDELALAI